MTENDFRSGRTPEQDEASDDVEVNPDAGASGGPQVPPDRELPESGEPLDDPQAERPRTPQAGL